MTKIYDGIMGVVVGDALGLPVEFQARDRFHIMEMSGYGSFDMPPGTSGVNDFLNKKRVKKVNE